MYVVTRVQTDVQQVDPTHFVCQITNPETVNHVVIFMTGSSPFPDGTGGAVHFGFASPTGIHWHFVGFISNEKPSAIFKISGLKQNSPSAGPSFMGSMNPLAGNSSQIGISVEPLDQIVQQTPVSAAQASHMDNVTQYTTKLLENFYNFASSFAINQSQMTPQPNVSFIPSTVLDQWYQSFKRKLQQDPNFWKR
ncbi:hypothetical protein BSL78_13021 [Apostichopus japonicus]|uniref:Uncharacterized protein n=1 Tax=Stichopus japonicus TaxID=307972 RepID=A0A2G8KQ43_STIJA|nr:hypothetical protein BSL78_13021 [Apostichopus japonicus]